MNLLQAIEQLKADSRRAEISPLPSIISCFEAVEEALAEQRVMHCANLIEDVLEDRNLTIDPNELRKILREELEK